LARLLAYKVATLLYVNRVVQCVVVLFVLFCVCVVVRVVLSVVVVRVVVRIVVVVIVGIVVVAVEVCATTVSQIVGAHEATPRSTLWCTGSPRAPPKTAPSVCLSVSVGVVLPSV